MLKNIFFNVIDFNKIINVRYFSFKHYSYLFNRVTQQFK